MFFSSLYFYSFLLIALWFGEASAVVLSLPPCLQAVILFSAELFHSFHVGLLYAKKTSLTTAASKNENGEYRGTKKRPRRCIDRIFIDCWLHRQGRSIRSSDWREWLDCLTSNTEKIQAIKGRKIYSEVHINIYIYLYKHIHTHTHVSV